MSAGHELAVALHVRGPVLSQATGEPTFGFDANHARAAGRPILPGSHVKGHLRHVFEQACAIGVPGIDNAWIARWFGKSSGNAGESSESGFEPESGRLNVGDLVADTSKCGTITRIAIDEDRGGVRRGMMQVVEAPWNYGETAVFEGKVRLQGATTEQDRAHLHDSLAWAFGLIPAVGAFKTAGFGRLGSVELAETWETLPATNVAIDVNAIMKAGGVDLCLMPHEPFLVWSHLHSGNFYAGDTVIPGQVLKAVAARWLADRGLLVGKEGMLARLIFRHAHPVPDREPETPRPITLPLSICTIHDGNEPIFLDALEDPDEFRGYASLGAVAFKPDWKTLPDEFAAYGPRARPRRDSRTRTAIKDGLARDEQLFTRVAVDPSGCVWRGQILIPPDADPGDRRAMTDLVSAFAGTSLGLGKTKAAMDWKPVPLGRQPTAAKHASGWRVVLQTPACLHGPHATRSPDRDPVTALRADYEAYWRDALDGAGRLVEFMALQRLAGGYLAKRYPVADDGDYEPYLLTDPGSIFLIEATETHAEDDLAIRLAAIAVTGLPLGSGWPEDRRNWRRHPFLPEAGWGEVQISDGPPVPEVEQ